MKTEYLRTAKNSYMIVKDADFEFESYELEMVLQNDLKNSHAGTCGRWQSGILV